MQEAATQRKQDLVATLKRAQLGVIQRYGMIFDVNAGLARLKLLSKNMRRRNSPAEMGVKSFCCIGKAFLWNKTTNVVRSF